MGLLRNWPLVVGLVLAGAVYVLWDQNGDLRAERNQAIEERDQARRGAAAATNALRYQKQATAYLKADLAELSKLEGADAPLSLYGRAVLERLRQP